MKRKSKQTKAVQRAGVERQVESGQGKAAEVHLGAAR